MNDFHDKYGYQDMQPPSEPEPIIEQEPEMQVDPQFAAATFEHDLKRGIHHPAHALLDQIDIASSFPTADSGQRIRVLLRQVRALL